MRPTRAIRRLILAVLGVVGAATGTAAQPLEVGGLRLEGDVEAGVRFFLDEPSKSRQSKFLEYRDINEGLFLQGLHLRLFRPDEAYSFEFGGRQWGLQDQEYYLRAGRLGRWEFGFDWDQIRHILSTNARMLATETSRGVFELPTPRPALAAYNSARELDEISVRWDTSRVFLRLTPAEDVDLIIEGTRIRKEGDRPFGVAMGSPGNNFLEVLQPIEQTIYDLRFRGTLARERWQLQFGYTLSLFQNDERRMSADNPCFNVGGVAPAGCGAADAAAIRRGESSLPPGNMAHTFSLAGGVNLPLRTRFMGNFTYSLRLQDESFLPHTVNPSPALASNPNLVLPKKDLDGNVQIFLLNLNATSRPLPIPVVFSGKYRLYHFQDWSDTITFPATVVNDRSLGPSRSAGRWSYFKQNADVDARWKIIERLAFTTGVGWERWDRNRHREVPVTDEFFAKGVLDYTPADWLMVRGSYVPSFRRIESYNSRAHAEHNVVDDPGSTEALSGQSVLLRKFDEAERNRQKVELQLQITPLETLSITPTVAYRWDDYIRSRLGLQQESAWSAGLDLNWSVAERLSFFGGYVHESIYQKQRSRSRTVSAGAIVDFVDFEWISNNVDTVDTFHAGLKAVIVPGKLDWKANGSFSTATGEIETRNPVAPASGGAALAGARASATAKRMPAFDDNLWRVETALQYHFWKSWTASLNYIFESFSKHDWRTDALNPFLPSAGNSIWLGNDQKNYTAHIIGLTLRYKFE